jgi:hypothetical protein
MKICLVPMIAAVYALLKACHRRFRRADAAKEGALAVVGFGVDFV